MLAATPPLPRQMRRLIPRFMENKNVLFKAPDEIEVLAQKLTPEIIKNHAE
jgi:hypothetical protein